MNFFEVLRIAFDALWASKLRTILTLLSNIIAVMSVISATSLMDGLNSSVGGVMTSEGTGVFQVSRINPFNLVSNRNSFLESLHNPKITISDFAFLREHVTLAAWMDVTQVSSTDVQFRRFRISSVPVTGRTENYAMFSGFDLQDGCHFSHQDVLHGRNVAIIGYGVADRLCSGVDPIAKEIRIAGVPFRIIGVLQKSPGLLGEDPNLRIVIPITSFRKEFGAEGSLQIAVKPASLDQTAACVDQTRLAMRSLRRLAPKKEDNSAIITRENLMQFWTSLTSMIFNVLIGVLSISFIVSGVIIMNIMLVSVAERTQEIGIRKAVGAPRRMIGWQFLMEAVTLSWIGGLAGTIFGYVTAATLSSSFNLPYAVKAWSIVAVLCVTSTMAVIFGAYPAIKASRLDPIEALRYE